MAVVEAGVVFQVDSPDAESVKDLEEFVTTLLAEALAKKVENDPVAIKVWASAHPHNEVRIAELEARHVKAMFDPEWGFTEDGKKLQQGLLDKAVEDATAEAERQVQDQASSN